MRALTVSKTVYMLGDEDTTPKYDLQINLGDLRGQGGNALAIIAAVSDLIKKQVSPEAAKLYSEEAKTGDYLNVLTVTGNTVYAVVEGIPDVYREAIE